MAKSDTCQLYRSSDFYSGPHLDATGVLDCGDDDVNLSWLDWSIGVDLITLDIIQVETWDKFYLLNLVTDVLVEDLLAFENKL